MQSPLIIQEDIANMNMATSSMDMAATTASSMSRMIMGTATAATASATAAAPMSMGGGSSCKISMLWNWYTIDACFIARSWHITSKGMFAGSCIGVILLVMSLEFLRRASREYDNYIVRQAERSHHEVTSTNSPSPPSVAGSSDDATNKNKLPLASSRRCAPPKFRPNVFQQMARATFHMVQFTIAYFIMLLAMYYNGYIIISIIIGAWLGAFVFSWESISLGRDSKEEATYCCG